MTILREITDIRREQGFCLQRQKSSFQSLKDSELLEMKQTYEEMDGSFKNQEIWHGIAALFSLFGIAAGAFPKGNQIGRILGGVGVTGDKSAIFFTKIFENKTSHLNGILDQLRKALEDLNQNTGDLSQNQRETLQICNSAVQEAEKALSAPFDKA